MKYLDELYDNIPNKPTLNKEETKNLIKNCKDILKKELENNNKIIQVEHIKANSWFGVEDIQKGDIISASFSGAPHPAIVFKVIGDEVYYIPCSSTEGLHNFAELKSRLFKTRGYLSKSIHVMTKSEAIRNFIGIYPNKAEIHKLFKELKQFYKKILN